MNRIVELGQLLDYYGAFLTERQSTLLRQYAFEDCSLSEIAEREGISRQAVRDAIGNGERQLRQYEDALGLCKKLLLFEKSAASTMQTLLSADLSEDMRAQLLTQLNGLTQIWEDEHGV